MELTQSSRKNGIDYISSATKLSNVYHAGNVVLISEDPNKLKVFLSYLNDSAFTVRTSLGLSNCKTLLPNRTGSKPNLPCAEVTEQGA